MIHYNTIFNWKTIYEYPFSDKINTFFIIWWNNVNILREKDFIILLNYLQKEKITHIDIQNQWFLNSFNILEFDFFKYKEQYLWKWDHNIFWGTNQWISLSEEFFWLVWWDEDFINFMITEIGINELRDRLQIFKDEWNSSKHWTWAYELIHKNNRVDFDKL